MVRTYGLRRRYKHILATNDGIDIDSQPDKISDERLNEMIQNFKKCWCIEFEGDVDDTVRALIELQKLRRQKNAPCIGG